MMRAQVTRDAGEARGSLDLDAIESVPLPATLKGLPQRAAGVALRDLGELRLSVLEGDLPLPIAVLKKSALEHNNQWMVAFARRANVSLCPHGKTTLAPQLFDQQLRAGCWGITAATATHLRIYRRFGVPRVILANQLIGRANVEIVLDELEADPGFDCYLLIDSIEGLELLRHAAERRGVARPIQALLEVGMPGGRTGVRSREAAVALGTAAKAAAPWVALRGVEAFEGIIHDPDP